MKKNDNKTTFPLAKNTVVPLEITATGSGMEGIGRYDGMAVFVPAAAEGDRLEVRIVKPQKNYAFGRIERIAEPSPDRVPPDCPAFPRCGGCASRHISYEAECRAKLRRVADAMQRIGGIDIEPETIIAADRPDRYRNKAQLPCRLAEDGSVSFGFYAERSHRIIDCGDCLLQPESFSAIAAAVKDCMERYVVLPYDEMCHAGLVRHLYMRSSRHTGEIMVCLVVNGDRLPHEEEFVSAVRSASDSVAGVFININRERTNVILGSKCRKLWGEDTITDRLLGLDFRISPLSFFQVNPAQAERLYAKAAEYADLRQGETLLDLYCGAGTIGLSMAAKAAKLTGVEVVPEAVEDARLNAEVNGITNAEFIRADAAEAASMLRERGERPDVVVLDPPRKGCDESLPAIIAGMEPSRVIYVSCDPATLARDCARFRELGYSAVRLCAVDMFPRTSHVECVVLMSKK